MQCCRSRDSGRGTGGPGASVEGVAPAGRPARGPAITALVLIAALVPGLLAAAGAATQGEEEGGTEASWPSRVLVTNDNGIEDVATLALARSLASTAEVFLVAPMEDRSGTSNLLSFPRTGELAVERREVGEGVRAWAVDGYPADCVVFAVTGPMADAPPDLVVSGINGGPNLADAWFGSGTIGAARTAAYLGIPALAVSGVDDDDPQAVARVVDWVVRLAGSPAVRRIEPPDYLTVSLPVGPAARITGVEIVERAQGFLSIAARPATDAAAADDAQVWSIQLQTGGEVAPDTDVGALARGRIAIVPMRVGDGDPGALDWLRRHRDLLPPWPPAQAE